MAKYSNQVVYDIKTTLDASGITKLQSELMKVQTTLNKISSSPGKMKNLGLNIDEVQLYQDQIEKLGETISKCFNSRTGMLNVNQFNAALKSGSLSVTELNGAFRAAGNQGKTAFNSMVSMMTNVNKQAVTVNSTMSKIANTFNNTVRWGITASIFQEMMGSVQGAVSYMKDLDESLTNIQMVTNSSKEDMRELAQYANNAAQALGSTTTDYTNAVKVFVQEGFSESESKQYANLSTKLANVSEQNTATTSDQITAYRNAFQLDYKQTVEAMDKVANVANNTASNVNELMTASQRAASVAQAVGSSQDSFLAAIATIESVTRQSAEEIGNGLKTIYQRFADIKVSGSTDDGVDYGQYANALKSVGVDVLDVAGQFKGMDQILSELQDVWSELDDTMKIAVGEKVAGKFQYNRFAALMNNPEYYQKALGATQGASGMMDQMNEYYMEGIEGRLNTLQAAGEQVMSTLFNQDTVEPVLENVTKIVNGLNSIVEVAGGGVPIFTLLSSLLLKTFSPQIASQITQIATNIATITQASNNMKNMQTAMNLAGQMGQGLDSQTFKVANKAVPTVAGLDQAAQEKMTAIVQQMAEAENKVVATENNINELAAQLTTKYQQRLNLTEEQAEELQIVLANSIKNNESQDQIRASVAGTLNLQEEDLDVIRLTRTEVNNIAQSYREMNAATEGVDANLRAADTAIEGFKSEQIARGFTQALSAVTSLVFAVQSFTSLMSILNSDTASFEEKINSILISGTMMFSMLGAIKTSLTGSFDAIATGLLGAEHAAAITAQTEAVNAYYLALTELTTAQDAYNAALATGTPEEIVNAEARVAAATAAKEEALSQVAAADSEVIDTEATLANTIAKAKEVLTKKVNTAVTSEGTIANTLYTISEKALALAGIEAAAGTMSLAASIAMIAAPVAIAVAAIAGIVAIYMAWQDSIHAASKEFEKQQELLSKTKKNYSDTRDEVESLKQSLDSIGETRSSLANLTKGTDEWREAVRKLNDQVLTLLQTYPELAQYVTNEDGVLNIDDVGMDKFYQQQLDKADHLASVNSIQQANTLQAQNEKGIEDFYNQWGMGKGLSKEEIKAAISEGAVELRAGADQLNAAFVELRNNIETNSLAIDNLSDSVGTLNTTYEDYTSNESADINAAKNAITEEFGTKIYDEYGNETGTKLDFSTMTNNQEFLDAVAQATGKTITGAIDTSAFDSNVKFKTNDGDEFEYTSNQLFDLLADSQAAIDLTNKKLEENTLIYEHFGAKYDESSKSFVDSSGNAVKSLKDLSEASTDEIAAIKAFQDGIYNDIVTDDFNSDSLEEFLTGLEKGTVQVDGFSEALSKFQVQEKEKEVSGKLEGAAQTEGFNINDKAKGLSGNLKLSSEEAKNVMSDMMKKLNESSLSDEEKLQLMDKINWDMPVEDIMANIQHAIDSGNIETAFLNNTNIEDDSERKTQVLEEYDIDESTLSAYKEQLETTGELAKQHDELAEAIENSKDAFGKETEETKEARKALSAFEGESEDIAVDLAQTQKGLESLSKNMAKYSGILKNGDKTTLEYAEALGTVKNALADTLNVSEESISNSLIESHLEDIEALAAGDEEALNRLRAAAGQDIVAGFYISEDSSLTTEHMEYLKQKAIELNTLDIEVAAGLDDQDFINALDDMLYNGELTKDQVNEYLRGIGYEPEFHTEKKETTLFSTKGMHVKGDILGVPYDITLPQFDVMGMVEVPQLGDSHSSNNSSSSSSSGSPLRRTASPTAPSGQTGISPSYIDSSYKPDTSSTKDSEPKEKEPKEEKEKTPKEDKKEQKSEWDYLTDITHDLDRAAATMEKLTQLEDRLVGANRVSQIQKIQKQLKEENKLLKEKLKLTQNHAEILRKNSEDENGNPTMNAYAAAAGVGKLKFDKNNNLINGRDIEQKLLKRVNDSTKNYNEYKDDEDEGVVKYYEDQLELDKQLYDGFMKAQEEYHNTLSTIEETDNQIIENRKAYQDETDKLIDSIQDGFDQVTKAIETKREFEKKYREWQEGGEGYNHSASNITYYSQSLYDYFGVKDVTSKNKKNRKIGKDSLFAEEKSNLNKRRKDAEAALSLSPEEAKTAKGKLSQVQARDNLNEALDEFTQGFYKAVDNWEALVKEVGEASEQVGEIVDKRLAKYDNIRDRLQTRLTQDKLLNGDTPSNSIQYYNKMIESNYDKLADIKTALDTNDEIVKQLSKIEASGKKLSTQEREQLQEARDRITKLQQEQIDTETTLLQDIKDRLSAQVNKELNKYIKKTTGIEDIDWAQQQWELVVRNDSKYFDDYNRSFELQKLELKYQNALNDAQTSSLGIQKKIADQMKEQLNWLRTKNKLSEYDIQYAEKNLQILQKQMALEEAKNNKTQMRLQRNAAGNYDFVYAANEDDINQSTQELLSAQQDAYNLSKQNYQQIYGDLLKTSQQLKSDIQGLLESSKLGLLDEKEFDARLNFLFENYKKYATDSTIEIRETWINQYNDVVGAEQLLTEENSVFLDDTFEEMRKSALQMNIHLGETLQQTQAQMNNTFNGEGGLVPTAQAGWDMIAASGDEAWNGMATNITSEEGPLAKITQSASTTWEGIKNIGITNLDGLYEEGFNPDSTETPLGKIKLGSQDVTKALNDDIKTAIGTLGEGFDSQMGVLNVSVSTIARATQTSIGNIQEYYKTSTEEAGKAVEKAGGQVNTFTQDSVKEATSALNGLRAATLGFNTDLGSLTTTITQGTKAISGWEAVLSKAWDTLNGSGKGKKKKKGLIETASDLAKEFGNIDIKAGSAADAGDKFNDTAGNTETQAYSTGTSVGGLTTEVESLSTQSAGLGNNIGTAYSGLGTLAKGADEAYTNLDTSAKTAKETAEKTKEAVEDMNKAADSTNSIWDWLAGGLQSAIEKFQEAYEEQRRVADAGWGFNTGYNAGWEWMMSETPQFASGGYTGAWFDRGVDEKNGKLAILHQKELVLNATDTENMLSTVEIVRDIMSGINNISSVGQNIKQKDYSDTIEQRVEVNATFPGVTEAIEIKQALEQLANNAYQAANKYNY